VDGVGWLEARGTSLVTAMDALQALVARRIHKLKDALESAGER
jgi:hypothetical protein